MALAGLELASKPVAGHCQRFPRPLPQTVGVAPDKAVPVCPAGRQKTPNTLVSDRIRMCAVCGGDVWQPIAQTSPNLSSPTTAGPAPAVHPPRRRPLRSTVCRRPLGHSATGRAYNTGQKTPTARVLVRLPNARGDGNHGDHPPKCSAPTALNADAFPVPVAAVVIPPVPGARCRFQSFPAPSSSRLRSRTTADVH